MVEGAGLENRYTLTAYRGFESHPLRHPPYPYPPRAASAKISAVPSPSRISILRCLAPFGLLAASSAWAQTPGERAEDASPWITIPIVTNLGHARNVILAHTSEALIAIGGSYGTLSEVAIALKIGVPVGAIASWRATRPGHPAPPIIELDNPNAAVRWALDTARERRVATGKVGPRSRRGYEPAG